MSSRMYAAGENRRDPGLADTASKDVDDNDGRTDDWWLQLARDIYTESDDYFNANIRNDVQTSLAHFGNRHAPGSKYYKEAYKHRSKGFRPKTRAMINRREAKAAVAMFSTNDIVTVSAERGRDRSHQVSAAINQALLQYRLTNTVKWFQTVIGAYQDTMNNGLCISHQFWNYEEMTLKEPKLHRDTGETIYEEGTDEPAYDESYELIKDTPDLELRPIENVLFAANCDWRDPVGTSSFIIDKIPMTIGEVKQMARSSGMKGKAAWRELNDNILLSGVTDDRDPIRAEREDNREDSKDQRFINPDYMTVWVHRNIVRDEGRDWVFYTLGVIDRLSDPIPLEEEYPWLAPGERPYKMGFSSIESHRVYPDSINKLASKTQQEANEINNQRRDNVALVLNRRYFVRKTARINYGSLYRNVPGGVVEMDDPNGDIKVDAPQDVTSSSYQEQDRINMDFDELTGHFSVGSVSTNRNMNETVGGMDMIQGSQDEMAEYPLRVFVETWVKPVLKQFVRMEQRHESDRALLALMGEKLELWQKFGINRVTDAWIQGSMNVEVNVGFGSTNPRQRVEKLAMGLNTVLGFVPTMAGRLDGEEVASEVFGALGYSDHERFFPKADQNQAPQQPEQEQMTQFERSKLELEEAKARAQLEEKNMERAHRLQMHYMSMEHQLAKMVNDKEITFEQFKLEREKMAADRQNKVDEFKVKLRMGSGI